MRMRAIVGLAAAVFTMFVSQAPIRAQTARPNVVLIVIDDMALNDYQVLLDKNQLPHLKSLIDTSVEFTNAFESGTVGSTSRISILTGQYAQNHHEKGADLWFGGPVRHNEYTLLPNWLRAAGYITGKVGRTVPGYGAGDLTPAEFSETSAVVPGGLPVGFYDSFPKCSYVPPGWDFWSVFCDPYTWTVHKYKVSVQGAKQDYSSYNTPTETFHQVDFVSYVSGWFITNVVGTGKPWFLEVAPVAYNRELWPGPDTYNVCPDPNYPDPWQYGGPYYGVSERPPLRHINTIWNADDPNGAATADANYPFPTPPSFNEEDVSDKPTWVQLTPFFSAQQIDCTKKRWWRRLELLKSIDDMVGYIVSNLTQTGQLNNTYIIFTSDNGMGDGQHRYSEKLSGYEEGIRVKFLIRRPAAPQPMRIDKMVLSIDIAPTIAHIAAATPNIAVDGRSLLPLMANPSMTWRKMGLLQHTLGPYDNENVTSPRDYWGLRINTTNPRLLLQYTTVQSGVTGEYYNLTADPNELNNLFADPTKQTEINGILPWLNAMKTCSGAWCRWLEDNFNR